MKKNVAGQTVCFEMLSTADGSAITSGTPTVYVTGDNGTQATGTGTKTHKGNGVWSYAPTQAETNYTHIAFTMVLSGAFCQTVNVYTTFPQTGDSYSAVGSLNNISSADVNAACDTALVDYGANKVAPPTAVEIRTEIDNNSAKLTSILEDTGTTLQTTLSTVNTNVSTLTTRLSATRAGYLDKLNVTGTLAHSNDAGTYKADISGLPTSIQIADAVWDEVISEHITAGTFGAKNQKLIPSENIEDYQGTSSGGDATLANQTTIIGHLTDIKGSSFLGSTDSLEAIRNRGDVAWITGAGGSAPTVEQIRTEIDNNSTKLTSILEDTGTTLHNTLSTVNTNVTTLTTRLSSTRAGYLDKLNVSGVLAHSNSANLYKADVSTLTTSLATVDNVVDSIKTDTTALLLDPTTQTAVDASIAAIADQVINQVLPDVIVGDLTIGQTITLKLALRALFNRFYREVTQSVSIQEVKNDSGVSIASMSTTDTGALQSKGTA